MKRRSLNWMRLWVLPITVLTVLAFTLFAGFYVLDHYVTGGAAAGPDAGIVERYVSFDPDKITDAVAALAGMIAAVLGIVITVVSIVVQLSADRYTGVAKMFMRDRVNIGVLVYFVVACVCGVWLSMSLQDRFVPRAAVIAMMAATTVGLVLILPYFAYVFLFLEPSNIIARIRRDAARSAEDGSRAGRSEACADAQESTLFAMEELSDITSNSISGKDKIIASRAIDALKDFTLEYLAIKDRASSDWFLVGDSIADNPDFVAMDRESLRDLEARRTWVEWKVLRQYLGIYNEAMVPMPDVNGLIAIDTRYIGEAAAQRDDRELVELVFRYMNSYLRAALNTRHVRTAYNVLNQYRLLLESMVRGSRGDLALQGVKHMNYYGHVSYDMRLTFITETVAYDISALCQHAHEAKAPDHRSMLNEFLLLDQPVRLKAQERGLLGVRKAQVKLAAYYLSAGDQAAARLVADDMKSEPAERLKAIRDELQRVESKDFREIIDRGRDFEYMPPEQRAQMAIFFEWLSL